MNQKQKASRFANLHVKGKPVLLYNAWDAGSAKVILDAGAKAIATSSWSVAEAHGYLAPDLVEAIVEGRQPRILTVKLLLQGIPCAWQDQRAAIGFAR
jgi:phosphoenolpyruvate phosphomutase-like protein